MLRQEELFGILLCLLHLLAKDEVIVIVVDRLPEWVVLVHILVGRQPVVLVQREHAHYSHREEVDNEDSGVLAPTGNHGTLGRELYDLDIGNWRLVHVLKRVIWQD